MKIKSGNLDKQPSKKKIHIPLGSLNRTDTNQPVYYKKKEDTKNSEIQRHLVSY